ncbi:MAG: FHA domain-containing protein [Steroidobacteraceae bacterium]|jgi:predicted component of type VI protein secretion system|nr:FHA domain-containing protein [Steroidobacteraceae bacterium]
MILTLEVIGEQAETLGGAARKTFDRVGGTIGRLADNDWVFPDRYVSGRHALIRYVNGRYFIEDASTNGVYINTPTNRLARGQPQPLADGDVVYIDAYKIRVMINRRPDASDDPFGRLQSLRTRTSQSGEDSSAQPTPSREPEEQRTQWLDLRSSSATTAPAEMSTQGREVREPDASASLQGQARPPAVAAPAAVQPPLHEPDVLAALRLAFEAALAHFDPQRMQEDFDRQIEQSQGLGPPARMRYWDMYRARYEAWIRDADAAFRTLFAPEFAGAYEEQLERLRSKAPRA